MQREEAENPLELPAPDDPIKRIHEFARDLAWGAVNKEWSSNLAIRRGEYWPSDIQEKMDRKWEGKYPLASLLISFAYLAPDEMLNVVESDAIQTLHMGDSYRSCFLTAKAFALLEKEIVPPKVFISYKRDESSALGLLIEARLKLIDKNIGVFIDKLLEPGDRWHEQLEGKVRQSRYFMCLLAPKSLGSKYVRNEIRWALDEAEKSHTVVIPICHGGYSIGAKLPDELQKDEAEIKALLDQLGVNNAITIRPESAEEYELAIIKILNKLGYSNI